MEKQKQYNWKDSNMALFGSDLEKKIKQASAKTEHEWEGTNVPGLYVWRIHNFKVEKVDKADYGQFYDGDSYIVLHVVKQNNELQMDIHFWIGKFSSQDEYGTAAYKTVELDNFYGGKPIQHREVMEYESEMFTSYFPNNSITILQGGYDSGFHRVPIEQYKKRLFAFKRGSDRKVTVLEVTFCKGSLNNDQTFVIDEGIIITVWHSPNSKVQEKMHSLQYAENLAQQRHGKAKVVVSDEPILPKLPDGNPEKTTLMTHKKIDPVVFKITDEKGHVEFISLGKFNKSALDSNDVFVVDVGTNVYIWEGKGSAPDERRESFPRAMSYLQSTDHPFAPITVVKEGFESKDVHFSQLLK